ncbi:MAG: glycerate kinase [Sedimentisphaerales bacterium]|nr:glycerate kinase [Sedimentisphaerales bacterium]
MKIVIAPDSFKGSLTATQACDAIEAGLRRIVPDAEIVKIPMADGGEGTVESLVAATGGHVCELDVTGPLAEMVRAFYGILGSGPGDQSRTAVIEMAAAAGLPQVPTDKRNPLYTTTYGFGELITHALDNGCRNFIMGIGGSATNDCGTGMAQALGVKFLDRQGQTITRCMTGELMGQVNAIDIQKINPHISQSHFIIACDVVNPLLGPHGASYVYGPQKGADEQTIKILESNMTHIIEIIEAQTHKSVRDVSGAGAAGGLGAGLMAFLNAQGRSGIDIVLKYSHFEQKIKGADLIITGEGKIDATTVSGKTLSGIARAGANQSIPVIALAGSSGPDAGQVFAGLPIHAILSICPGPMDLSQALEHGAAYLADTAEQAIRLVLLNIRYS